jgi:S-DNA-T family DNA segregation ATPase FtsK/SpoIIIE
MTDTTTEPVNGHADPQVSLLKFAPETSTVVTAAETADLAVEEQPRTRRRVRIDHLRRVVVEAREHDTYRVLVRHGSYLVGGTRILTRRAWDARTTARHERFMRIAEAAGQEDVARDWEQRAYIFRQSRHRRRMELLQLAVNAPKAIAMGTVAGGGILLMLGIMLAWANHDAGDVLAPIHATIQAVAWAAFIASVIWDPLLTALPWIALMGVWAVGRHRQTAPAWALPEGGEDRDAMPDEGAIIRALGNLGIAPLNKAIKEGWQPRWVQPTTRLGEGWHTQLQLPIGCSVEMIADKKSVLAHNLLRKPVEVWPVEPREQAGVLDLWVADQGVLTKPLPPWPLLTEGTSDFFRGVPVALNARGDKVIARLMASNFLLAGIMGSGKSSLVVALLLGAMLDPLVEVDVHVLAYNVDYDAMRPRLRSLTKGDEDEHIAAALETLRNLVGEVSRRGQALEDLGGIESKLTREIAENDPTMRPRIVLFDEVHELFTHPEHGKEAKELALKVTKKARKTGIVLLWVTPDADAASLPRGISKTVSHRVAFAINDHAGNDAILGTGMHKAGYSATTLVAGEDVGTAMAAGFGKTPGLIRAYYIRKDKSVDEITPVVERAVALRDGITPAPAVPAAESLDPLADVAAVLGHEPRMLTQEVLHRLAERRPDAYREWGPMDLKRALEPYGAEPYKSAGKSTVSRDRVHDAILERLDDDTDDEGGDEI